MAEQTGTKVPHSEKKETVTNVVGLAEQAQTLTEAAANTGNTQQGLGAAQVSQGPEQGPAAPQRLQEPREWAPPAEVAYLAVSIVAAGIWAGRAHSATTIDVVKLARQTLAEIKKQQLAEIAQKGEGEAK